jgi:phage/conjugal plasmid C-4 type zinc finger TraR family protein
VRRITLNYKAFLFIRVSFVRAACTPCSADRALNARARARRRRATAGSILALREDETMATGWAGDGAVQEQIDATVKDGIQRARAQLPSGKSRTRCEECDAPIPAARRKALPGVKLCVPCQEALDEEQSAFSGYNRRGSKDSQLR